MDYTEYMGNILLIGVLIVVFVIGIVSPHTAGKIQRKTDDKTHWLKRMANWLWDPIAWWTKSSLEVSRNTIVKVAELGKKTRRKADH